MRKELEDMFVFDKVCDSDNAKPLGSNYTITYSGVTCKFTIASDGACPKNRIYIINKDIKGRVVPEQCGVIKIGFWVRVFYFIKKIFKRKV